LLENFNKIGHVIKPAVEGYVHNAFVGGKQHSLCLIDTDEVQVLFEALTGNGFETAGKITVTDVQRSATFLRIDIFSVMVVDIRNRFVNTGGVLAASSQTFGIFFVLKNVPQNF
jgi:hypothetical protein